MKKLILLLCSVFLYFSCKLMDPIYLQKDIKKAMLTGKVFTEEGLPLEGATVTLTDFVTTRTDINGVFLFNFVRYGKYELKFEKENYSDGSLKLVYNFKNRKLPFITVKLLSLNYLISEGFEYLKEKKYSNIDVIFEKIEKIKPDEESYLYLKALYYLETKKYEESRQLLENLKIKDRNNIYYQLTLIKVYEKLDLYEDQALLMVYVAKNNLNDYYQLLKNAAEIYRDRLGNNDKYEELMKEYNINKEIYKK